MNNRILTLGAMLALVATVAIAAPAQAGKIPFVPGIGDITTMTQYDDSDQYIDSGETCNATEAGSSACNEYCNATGQGNKACTDDDCSGDNSCNDELCRGNVFIIQIGLENHGEACKNEEKEGEEEAATYLLLSDALNSLRDSAQPATSMLP